MDQFERDQIVGEINGCKLTAEVAVAARNDELVEHLASIIKPLNLREKITIEPASNALQIQMPRIKMIMPPDENQTYPTIVYLEFCYSNNRVYPQISVENLAYRAITSSNNPCMLLKAATAVAEKLDEIEAHINSDMFKAYEADIKAYTDAGKNLETFDAKAREEKIKQTALAFHADQLLKDRNGRTHLVKKATLKRLWLSDWHYYNGHPKQSEDKMLIAEWVVDGKWTICV